MKDSTSPEFNSVDTKVIRLDIKDKLGIESYSEDKIWDAFRSGNQDALIYIYNKYFPELLGYGLQFTKDREGIKDCIQNMFVDLFKNRKNLNSTTSIKFYLYRALRRRLSLSIKDSWFYSKDITHNPIGFVSEQSTEDILIKEEKYRSLVNSIENVISKLSPRQREIIYYYYYEGFSYEEIASLMNMTKVKSARTLLYRAIDAIRQHIEQKQGGLSQNGINIIIMALIFVTDYQPFINLY